MKRILIVNNNLHVGGVQKALVNLLQELEWQRELEITLMLFSPRGALMERIPENVRVITPAATVRCWGLVRGDTAPLLDKALRVYFAGLTRLLGRSRALKTAFLFQRKLRGYDVAISFLHSGSQDVFYGGCNEFVLRCVKAEKKYTFLHCDYEAIRADCPENRTLYAGFHRIAACSEGCRDAFLRVLPQLTEKTATVPNCCDLVGLAAYADAQTHPVHTPLRVITVARLGREKGVPRAIQALATLGSRIDGLHYTVVGDGVELETCRALIARYHLEQIVTLVGERYDPYAVLSASDVLLIPSVSEAAPLVIGEAAALGVPTLTTETSSAIEMVEQTGYGWVVENSEDGILQGIEWLLNHPDEIEKKKKYLNAIPHDNRIAVESFMELIN